MSWVNKSVVMNGTNWIVRENGWGVYYFERSRGGVLFWGSALIWIEVYVRNGISSS